MRIKTIWALVPLLCSFSISLGQRGHRAPRPTGGPGDPFAFRRFFHPLAEQRMMNSLGLNYYQPNLAALSMLFDMELPDALLFGAMSGGHGSQAQARRHVEQNPFLVALGLVDGADVADAGQGRARRGPGRGRRRRPGGRRPRPAGGPRQRPAGGPQTRAPRRGGARGQSEAGPGGASEAGP